MIRYTLLTQARANEFGPLDNQDVVRSSSVAGTTWSTTTKGKTSWQKRLYVKGPHGASVVLSSTGSIDGASKERDQAATWFHRVARMRPTS